MRDTITIKTFQWIDKLVLVLWMFLFAGSLLTFLDKDILKVFGIFIPVSLIGLVLSLLKCTRVIIFDFNAEVMIIKNFLFKKVIPKAEILTIQRVSSVAYGDWFGVILKKDKYGNPIKISFPPKLTTDIQHHADLFEKETLPLLMNFLK